MTKTKEKQSIYEYTIIGCNKPKYLEGSGGNCYIRINASTQQEALDKAKELANFKNYFISEISEIK